MAKIELTSATIAGILMGIAKAIALDEINATEVVNLMVKKKGCADNNPIFYGAEDLDEEIVDIYNQTVDSFIGAIDVGEPIDALADEWWPYDGRSTSSR